MSVLQLLLTLGFLGTLTYLVLGWPKRFGALSDRSWRFRLAGLGLLLVLFALGWLAAGMVVGRGNKVGAIRYLSLILSCVLVTLSLTCVALLDGLESYSVVRKERRGELNKLIEETTRAARNKSESE
jgi:Na+/melibiose symporter-like transporter